jgi:hypothetical protein
MIDAPIIFSWTDDGVMKPLPRFTIRCDREFVVGERYSLIQHEERSGATHRHFFACINDAFTNLPEDLAGRFKTAEHLRKWALIKCGYCEERTLVFSTPLDARRAAAFVTSMDDYVVVLIKGSIVSVYSAASQSPRAMNKDEFQASKRDVLELIAGMIGVSASDLAAQSRDYQDEPEHDHHEAPQTVTEKPQHNTGAAQEAAGEPEAVEAPTQGATSETSPRKAGGRPKGSKNKPKDGAPASETAEAAPEPGQNPTEPAPTGGAAQPNPPEVPKNPAEYIKHARVYIAAATVPADLEAQWRSEKPLRTNCGVDGEAWNIIYGEFKTKVEALKKGG